MDDPTYYARRAERQLELAQRATEAAAWNAHFQLATLYRERARVLGERQQAIMPAAGGQPSPTRSMSAPTADSFSSSRS